MRATARCVLAFCLFAFPAFANTDYKLLIDLDAKASTGCTLSGMNGVDRVITTTVDPSGSAPRVTAVTRQDCSGGSLGTPIMIDNSGWPAASNTASGVSIVETRIPLGVFGSPMPPSMRIGFVVSSGGQSSAVLTDADGNPLMFPGTGAKRRAVGGSARAFTVDGSADDWAGLWPLASGEANQSNAFRLLNVFAFTTGEFAYFRFDFQSNSSAPTARNDSYATPLNTPLTVPAPGVLGNDFDPNSRPLTASQITAPLRGVLVLNADGSLTYTPDGTGIARETFTYQASNGTQPSNVARVDIRVGQENHAPNAADDNYTVLQGGTLDIAPPGILVNDTDPDGDPLHAILGATTTHGALTLNADGSFHYVNDGASTADDQFTYFANDGVASSHEATVRIHVNPSTPPTSAPRITVPATNVTVCAGATATFTAIATGLPAPSVQWSVSTNGGATFTDIPGATTTPLSFVATAADNGHLYRATFTNPFGSASTTATLTVNTAPAITTQPVAQAVNVGSTATFTVAASGSPTVQWQVSTDGGATFTNIAGANSTTYSFTATMPDNGHQFRAVLTNSCGTVTSAAAALTATCAAMTVTNPATTTAPAGAAFSQTFTQTGGTGTVTFTTASALPAGLALAANGTLSGTPTQTGSFPITVLATDSFGCTGTSAVYNLAITCPVIAITNPATASGTVSAPFSQQFTQTGAVGTAAFTTASALPAGLTLAANGTLSGTPTQTGTFPIIVVATDANGCTGTSAAYNLVISCQTITITNPATTTGIVSTPFSQQFTQTAGIGAVTFTTASPLPAGLTLSSSGLLSGTPLQTGTFPIVVLVTDANGCTGTSATYNLVIGCQTITVTNPATTTSPAGTPLSINFTQTGAVGAATFTTASTLPTGLTLAANGTLSGTPLQGGTFPIVVTVTDGNGCTGTNPSYSLTLTCPTITITNPGVNSGTAGVAFSQTFTQAGGAGTITWTETGALPPGITLNSASGVLSGTTTQPGTFPITVTATDQNGCLATSPYTLTIGCQTVTVTNPGVNTGTVDAAFSQTFAAAGILGTVTWSETGALPAGITLNASSGVLSGTPTVTGSFPITVQATDTNGCFGTSSYTLTIACQTITVTNPVTNSGTANSAFSQTFTQTGAHGTATFTTASTLPAGLTLSTSGVLSGAPTQVGAFPIVVTVTDSNGCTGTGATYTLTINCQTLTVVNPVTTTGTVSAAFSQMFTSPNAVGTTTFTTASTLPAGLALASNGTLSGTPTQTGSFPIVVNATDSNGCTGVGATYTLVIGCQTIAVTNPVNTSGPVNVAFSEQFTQTGAVGGATFTTASALPTGLTLSASGLLSGTPTQGGTFPIVVTVTDGNGCTGVGATYSLTIVCPTITVTNAPTSTGTAGVAFNSGAFTQTGGNGTITWSVTGTLPAGITLDTNTGVLSGTTTQAGVFPITVTATDQNFCTGTGPTFNLAIACQTISITNPAQTSVQANTALNVTFTATGILGTATWSETGTLPSGITLDPNTGVLSGTSTQQGSFPLTIIVTDTNSCFATSAYTLDVTCPAISVTRTGGGVFPAGTLGTAYAGQSFTASGAAGPYTFAVTGGTFPAGLTLNSNGTISGTPTATGTFNFTVTATDVSTCAGSASFSIAIAPAANPDSYNNLVNNTEAVVTGGATASPATPFVSLTGTLIANDLPAGGVAVNAGTFATTQGGSVTIAADGTFKYTPPVTASALTSDTFTYTITSDTGGTGTPAAATGTATLNLSGRVWYVQNNAAAGNGQSQSPFNTLASFTNGARVGPDAAGDIIFVYTGDGTTTNQNAGVVLLDNEQLIGQGVALVVNGNTLVTAGAKPVIGNTTGPAVTLANGNTLKGFTATTSAGASLSGISGNLLTTGPVIDTVNVTTVTGAGINITNSGTIVTSLTNVAITGAAVGINGATFGTLTINPGVTVAAVQALAFSGTTSTCVVNGTFGTVTATGGTNGVAIGDCSGTILIPAGSSLSGASGDEFVITGSAPTINVTYQGNITYSGASSAIRIAGTVGTYNGTITFDTGALTVTGGTGVNLVAANGTHNYYMASGSANINGAVTGVSLGVNTNGTYNFGTAFSITNTTSTSFIVSNTAADVTYNGNITQGNNALMIGITSLNSAGFVTFQNGTLSATNGTGISMADADGPVTFTGLTTLNGGDAAIDVSAGTDALNGSAGTISFSANTSITNPSGPVIDIQGSRPNFTYSGTFSKTSAGTGINIQNNKAGLSVLINGASAPKTLSTSTGTAINITGNITPAISFTGGNLSVTTTTGIGVNATGGGTLTFTGAGNDVSSGNTALLLNGMALGASTLNNVTSTGGTNGISLTNVTGGTLAITTGSLSGSTGATFFVSGGSVSVSYGGTVTQNSAARLVDIANTTGGTISFTDAVTGLVAGASSTGISINTANSNVTFTKLALGTSLSRMTNQAVTITNGGTTSTYALGTISIFTNNAKGVAATNFDGTLNITGGSIDSSNATALDVDGPVGLTTLGVSLTSITSAGGTADGISIQDTNGTFTIIGDGANTSVGGNSSGGTISNKSGADGSTTTGIGIYLNNVTNITLRRIAISGTNQNNGIKGLSVAGFVLEYSTIGGTNGTAASLAAPENYGEGTLMFGNATSNGLTGTVIFTSNSISGGRARNLSIVNGGAASTTTLTVKGCTFGAMQNFSDGNQSFAVEARTSGSTFNTTFGGPNAGEPNTLSNAVSDLCNFTGQTGTTMDVQFRNNVLSNNSPNNIIGGGSLNLSTQGSMTFVANGNTMRDANGSAVTLFKASSGSLLSGQFTNNTIGVAAVAKSGSATGNGIFVSAGGTGTMSFTMSNNVIHQIAGNAHIYADNTGGSYTANFTIQGNTLDTPVAPGWFAGIAITNGSPGSSDTINVCANIGGAGALANVLNFAGNLGVIVGSSGAAAGHTFNLPGYAGGANLANVEAFIQGRNTGSFTTTAYADAPATASAFTGSGTICPTP